MIRLTELLVTVCDDNLERIAELRVKVPADLNPAACIVQVSKVTREIEPRNRTADDATR